MHGLHATRHNNRPHVQSRQTSDDPPLFSQPTTVVTTLRQSTHSGSEPAWQSMHFIEHNTAVRVVHYYLVHDIVQHNTTVHYPG